MTAKLPRLCEIMSEPVAALTAARPKARGAGLHGGLYGDIMRGWEAQAGRFRRYLAAECAAARLPFAEEQALRELTGSEFWVDPELAAQTAVGEAVLVRADGSLPAGAIKTGHRFSRTADPLQTPEIAAAQFTAVSPIYVAQGQTQVTVPIVAGSPGVDANRLQFVGESANGGASIDTLFDANFTVSRLQAAGGSDGIDDAWQRQIAKSMYAGQFGPTDAALIAGAFDVPRVRHIALSLDTQRAVTRLFVGDVSWASSTRLGTLVKQQLRESPWLGFGGRVEMWPIKNILIGVNAGIVLKNQAALDSLEDIQTAVRDAVRTYFDWRPDFYTWRLRALRATIARAHSKILTCSSVVVRDSVGATLSEPAAKLAGTAEYAPHYWLSADAVGLTFSVPS